MIIKYTVDLNRFHNGYVRGSPNGKICKSTNGTVGTIFTNTILMDLSKAFDSVGAPRAKKR